MKKIILPLIIFAFCASSSAFGLSTAKYQNFKKDIDSIRKQYNESSDKVKQSNEDFLQHVKTIETYVDELYSKGIQNTNRAYLLPEARKSIEKNNDINWDDIETTFIEDLEAWIKSLKNKINP